MRVINELYLAAEISKKLSTPAYESPQRQVVRINRTLRAEEVVNRPRLSSFRRTPSSPLCPMSSHRCQKRGQKGVMIGIRIGPYLFREKAIYRMRSSRLTQSSFAGARLHGSATLAECALTRKGGGGGVYCYVPGRPNGRRERREECRLEAGATK